MTQKTETVKYYYAGLGAGMLTIAYILDGDRESNKRTVKFGFAYCNPNDNFSKKDVVKKHVNRKYNKETQKTEILDTKIEVVKGGRTRAYEKLINSPVTMEINVSEGELSPVAQAITCMYDYCATRGPSWKDKTRHTVTKKGAHTLYRDGFKLTFADPNRDNLITLETPWGVESV